MGTSALSFSMIAVNKPQALWYHNENTGTYMLEIPMAFMRWGKKEKRNIFSFRSLVRGTMSIIYCNLTFASLWNCGHSFPIKFNIHNRSRDRGIHINMYIYIYYHTQSETLNVTLIQMWPAINILSRTTWWIVKLQLLSYPHTLSQTSSPTPCTLLLLWTSHCGAVQSGTCWSSSSISDTAIFRFLPRLPPVNPVLLPLG